MPGDITEGTPSLPRDQDGGRVWGLYDGTNLWLPRRGELTDGLVIDGMDRLHWTLEDGMVAKELKAIRIGLQLLLEKYGVDVDLLDEAGSTLEDE